MDKLEKVIENCGFISMQSVNRATPFDATCGAATLGIYKKSSSSNAVYFWTLIKAWLSSALGPLSAAGEALKALSSSLSTFSLLSTRGFFEGSDRLPFRARLLSDKNHPKTTEHLTLQSQNGSLTKKQSGRGAALDGLNILFLTYILFYILPSNRIIARQDHIIGLALVSLDNID